MGLIGDGGIGSGERRGALSVRDGLEEAAVVEMLRDSFGFMALDASMMAVVMLMCLGVRCVLDLDVRS